MYIPRLLYHSLAKALQHFPAVLITGPRQSGKTTFLLQEGGPGYSYVSFDDPLERNFAVSEFPIPMDFLIVLAISRSSWMRSSMSRISFHTSK